MGAGDHAAAQGGPQGSHSNFTNSILANIQTQQQNHINRKQNSSSVNAH